MTRKKVKESIVKAVKLFVDARTGKGYQKGDVVVGWEKERAEHYAQVGLVEIVSPKPPAPVKKDPELFPPETDSKPAPKVTKPKRGPTKTK